MYMITSWREVCAMLKPGNLKLLLLVSLKASVQSYRLLLRNWWWLLGIIALADILLTGQILVEPAALKYHVSVWWVYGYFMLKFLLWFVLVLSARSSIKNKNMRYFLSYIAMFFIASVLISALVFCILGLISVWTINILRLKPSIVSYLGIRYFIAYFLVIWNFFLLDHGTPRFFLKDLFNALRMAFLNLPFILVSFVFFNIVLQSILRMCEYFMKPLPWGIQLVLQDTIFLIIIVLIINIVSTFYLKRVHDQGEIYFPK